MAGLGLDSDQARWAIREIKSFLDSYRKWIHSLVLFGSYALGQAGRHSDVDFLVLLKNGEKGGVVIWDDGNNSFYRRHAGKEMTKIAVQIYEIQDPREAENMIELGVDHIGSVILNEEDWKVSSIKETFRLTEGTAAKNSLLPLFNTPDKVKIGVIMLPV